MLFHSLSGGTLSENPHVKVHDISLLHLNQYYVRGSLTTQIPSNWEKIYPHRIKDVEFARTTIATTPADLQTFLSLNLALLLHHS